MSRTLNDIADQLRDADKKVQLIFAFNSTGKTRLSMEFKRLVDPSNDDGEIEQAESSRSKVLYYNAFTEDLFYWNNNSESGREPKLNIQANAYTNWLLTLLKDLGQDGNIVKYFQHYVNDKLTPQFGANFTDVVFSLERGNGEYLGNLKISKGEESVFIWSIFFTLIEQVVSILNTPERADREINDFDQLEYVFIDDPVCSLDENHLIELSVSLDGLIKSSASKLKFIVTTHSPLFYNVLYNELNSKTCYLLEHFEDGTYELTEKHGDSNKSFSYHLLLKQIIEQAIAENNVQRYHFTLLRNLYEKTASFLGYPKWSELLPDDKQLFFSRIIQFTSHRALSNEVVAEPTPQEKQTVKILLDNLIGNYGYWQQEQKDG